MGKFYVALVNITLNRTRPSYFMEKYFLFSTDDCDVKYEAVEICNRTTNQLCMKEDVINSDIELGSISSGRGIIKDSRNNKRFILNTSGKSYDVSQSCFKLFPSKQFSLCMDGYAVSLFLFCLNSSQKYVDIVTKHMSHKWSTLYKQNDGNFQLSKLQIKIREPQRHVMDLMWAKMACNTIHELRQLQYAMSWLSTLGGAFSALGEQQERCAKAAGAISIEQLRIALKLGDNIVITQCKLYFSLSMIQRGYCKLAKKIILEQYCGLRNSSVLDRKTLNMCKGIWARLKYELQERRKAKLIYNCNVSH